MIARKGSAVALSRVGGVAVAAALAFAPPAAAPAFAHAADRGFVLLLPTDYYAFGGALAVAVTFLVIAWVPAGRLRRLFRRQLALPALPDATRILTSLLAFVVFALLVASGFAGSRDPLSNPLPLFVWTVLWVGLTLVQGTIGNVWRWIDPWYGPWRLAVAVAGRGTDDPPPFVLPRRLGYVPAIAGFAAFAWFELVYPAPDDPERLAWAVALYWLYAYAGALFFGHREWSRRAEFLSVFYSMIARLAVIGRERPNADRPALRLPGAGAVAAAPLPASGALFLLAALSTVSFDGLMRTFAWLNAIGINPLEFPGRSAVVAENTVGLAAMFVALAGAFLAAVAAGRALSGETAPVTRLAGRLVWSIVPISLAYHFSHYLVAFVINVQYAAAAISDPLARGWNLFGTAGLHVQAGATMGADSAWLIWNAQAAAIIGGHVLAVVLAHAIAGGGDAGRRPLLGQLPLAILMVAYTVFGLWLLASPTGA